MTVELLTPVQRAIAIAAIAAVMVAALVVRRRWPRAAAGCATAAGLALLLAAIEALIPWIVREAAPVDADFNEFHWILLSPWGTWGVALGSTAAAVVAWLGWRASRRVVSPWRRAAMVGLRCGAALTALILLLEPAIRLSQVAREPNRIAILIDDSRSMALRESPGGPSRAQRARALLEASRPTFAAWEQDHHVDVYTFSDALVPSSLEAVATAEPQGRATLFRQALEQLRPHYDGRDLAGVVLVSDGVPTGDFQTGVGGEAREFLRSLDTRVHTAWAGRPGLVDVAIARVLADEFAFVRTVVRIEAVIRATGYDRRRIPVTLHAGGVPLRQKWVEIGPGETETPVVFELSPPRVGKYVYRIDTPVADDEAVAENNERSFVMRVIRDKIRVLQVAGQPSWDVRALRRLLKQNPNVDLISFFILRTVEDDSRVPNNEMSLIPFPTRELFQNELPSFDLIVLQNFEYLPYGIGAYLENIRRYVDGGGGLAMLGGAFSFGSGGYYGTPVADALPVELPQSFRSPGAMVDTRMFSPALTATGKIHPVTALRYEPRSNAAVWQGLPQLEGVNVVGDAKPGASVLAVHPTLKTRSGKPMPVIVAGEHGDGRTLAVTTDSLWRWGFVASAQQGDDGRHYAKLWENITRWLIQDPELEHLHVSSDAVEYGPGEPVMITVRLVDRDYSPVAGGQVSVEVMREVGGADDAGAGGRSRARAGREAAHRSRAGADVLHRRDVTTGEGGDAGFQLADLAPGVYRVRASAKVSGRPAEASDIFLVRAASAELDQPGAVETALRDVAAATGGRYLGPVAALPEALPFDQPRIVRVDRRADVELWSRPALLGFALLFLGLEWVLRQRSGYL